MAESHIWLDYAGNNSNRCPLNHKLWFITISCRYTIESSHHVNGLREAFYCYACDITRLMMAPKCPVRMMWELTVCAGLRSNHPTFLVLAHSQFAIPNVTLNLFSLKFTSRRYLSSMHNSISPIAIQMYATQCDWCEVLVTIAMSLRHVSWHSWTSWTHEFVNSWIP